VRGWPIIALLGCGESPTLKDTGQTPGPEGCAIVLTYRTQTGPDGVQLVGSFNDWKTDATPLTKQLTGMWTASLSLPPGHYPYSFIETTRWSLGSAELWTCDADNPLIHCDEGTASDLGWQQQCSPGTPSCSSLLVVEDCSAPTLGVHSVAPSPATGTVVLELSAATPSGAQLLAITAGDEAGVYQEETGVFHVELSGLSAQRHTIWAQALDAESRQTTISIPLDMDDWSWAQAIIYHAMIDRVANGSTANDNPEGTTHPITDYAGGDLAGLKAALPYLEDLGVNTLWLSNPQAGPEGAWPGDCSATYAGYHGFWPVSWDEIDPHLGNKKALRALIAAAHRRGMRVIIDWVGNHVHQDHPILQSWSETAIHPAEICSHSGPDGRLNWDRIPESCWFAPYLPDLDQSDPAVLSASVDKAVEWAEQYELDGLRVDAAKHMPHSVSWNLQSRIQERLEHRGSGFDFNLLGETFDGADAINAFIGPNQLDGQFDFPLYWQLRDAFITDTASLRDVVQTASSTAARYPGGRMSTFLGNLDVGRFITVAAEGTSDVCPGGSLRQAEPPDWDEPYDRLLMAWTFLLSQPGMPLIYYGDEMGLPGFGDPDNRQPLWWTADVMDTDVETVASQLELGPARVLRGVRALTAARRTEPALATGSTIEWWAAPEDHPSLYAYARTDGNSGALVLLSRWAEETTISNGLGFAGLPPGRDYEDVLTGEIFVADGDQLTVTMPPMSARLLLPRAE
jgi:glycosidase